MLHQADSLMNSQSGRTFQGTENALSLLDDSTSKANATVAFLLLLIFCFVVFFLRYRKKQISTRRELYQSYQTELEHMKEAKQKAYLQMKSQMESNADEYEANLHVMHLIKSRLQEENQSLKSEIDRLKLHSHLTTPTDDSRSFLSEDFVLRIFSMAGKPSSGLQEADWEELAAVMVAYYPSLMTHLSIIQSLSVQDVRACMLVCLCLHTDDIARLLGVSKQRATNIKANLNAALFGSRSARPLYKNLVSKYGIEHC